MFNLTRHVHRMGGWGTVTIKRLNGHHPHSPAQKDWCRGCASSVCSSVRVVVIVVVVPRRPRGGLDSKMFASLVLSLRLKLFPLSLLVGVVVVISGWDGGGRVIRRKFIGQHFTYTSGSRRVCCRTVFLSVRYNGSGGCPTLCRLLAE